MRVQQVSSQEKTVGGITAYQWMGYYQLRFTTYSDEMELVFPTHRYPVMLAPPPPPGGPRHLCVSLMCRFSFLPSVLIKQYKNDFGHYHL